MAMRDYPLGTTLGLQVMADQWFGLILLNLGEEWINLMDMRARVRGISSDRLLLKAARLHQLGMVELDADYRLRITARGRELQEMLIRLNQWGDDLMTERLASQA